MPALIVEGVLAFYSIGAATAAGIAITVAVNVIVAVAISAAVGEPLRR